MTTVLASAADERYGYWLLNLIGSVKANTRGFDRIAVYDLGLSPRQRRLLGRIRTIDILSVPRFVPHWLQGRSWKLWIWRNVGGSKVLWLDAGVSVLSSLDDPLAQIDERGYFAVSNGHPNRESTPSDWYELFDFPRELGERTGISTGIFGFATTGPVFEQVVVPSYEDAVAGHCLGFSAPEADRFNAGIDRSDDVVVRDCPLFRWDQSVVNVRFFKAFPDAYVNDVFKYGGWQSPHDHPEQLLWNHRRRGDYRYMSRVPFRWPFAPLGRAWGLGFRWRWWARNHTWLFRPRTYMQKAWRILGGWQTGRSS